ncbi:amino acid adenylation domain-containing protein [Alteromonas sp. a30]|uniref:amino acid adenylation domain-containing protein n=1 Tax=Alteromonas sp. a30 TaxID=2730917 RepID=UPI002280D138|nr:non-ribosomal peptide synthetase [Alteromonas sp. a30]MCY7294921.1 amino acid adenylation domain-containing protein [Alteromonas sp. a30]
MSELNQQRDLLLRKALIEKGLISNESKIEQYAAGSPYPVSMAQQRLWLLHQLEPSSTAYNMSAEFPWQGELDLTALKEAWNALLNRHEILRTTFENGPDFPVQVVQSAADVDIELVELDAQSDAQARLKKLEMGANHVFDLNKDLPIRLVVLHHPEHGYDIQIVMHHIVADAWSIDVLTRDLVELYLARVENREPALPELSIQYGDFAAWQRQQIGENQLEAQLSYWKQKLQGADASPVLPYDLPTSADAHSQAGLVQHVLTADTLSGLKQLSTKTEASLFMVCLAALKALAYRYSSSHDILIGIPVWNRNHPDLENLVGFFVNTLAIRTKIAPQESIESLIQTVKGNLVEALEYQDAPLDRVVEQLELERQGTSSPLINTMFSMQNAPEKTYDASAALNIQDVKFDLNVEMTEFADALTLRVEFDASRYSHAFIQQFSSHLNALLTALASHSAESVASITFQSSQELAEIQGLLTGEQTDASSLILPQFLGQAQLHPDAVAVSDEQKSLTYSALDNASSQLALTLQEQGVTQGDVVAIALPRSADLLTAYVATLKLGAVFLSLDVESSEQRNSSILTSASPKVLVTDAQGQQTYGGAVNAVCLFDNITDATTQFDAVSSEPQAPAYLIYTSGSTGEPKGIQVSHGALANLVNWLGTMHSYGSGEVCSQLAGAAFDAALCEWWPALCHGGEIRVVPETLKHAPAELIEWLNDNKVSVAFMPTPLVEACFTLPWSQEHSLKTLITGGEALMSNVPAGLSLQLLNIYGPAENACATTCAVLKAGDTGTPSIGKTIANVTNLILDAQGQIVPKGVVGGLYISGASLADGYYLQDALTAERFVEINGTRFYRSGDNVKLGFDGQIHFVGRNDEQVNLRGYRIELEEVRVCLSKLPGVIHAAVLVQTTEAQGAHLVAYYDANGKVSDKDVLAHLRASLPYYMVPTSVKEVSPWPTTNNGKVDKTALTSTALDVAFVADTSPLNTTEELIAGIWKSLLNVEKVHKNDNFFRLGGHSLLATQFVSRVKAAMGLDLPLKSLFEAPELADFAEGIDKKRWHHEGFVPPPLEAYERNEEAFPQSFAQQRLWFLEQLNPKTTTYSVPAGFVLEGDLDIAALNNAFDQLIQRHEILRTTFSVKSDGQFTQKIHSHAPSYFNFTDFSQLSPDAAASNSEFFVQTELSTPIDLTHGPVLRVTLIKTAPDRHILLINQHHIVTDAWSMEIMFRELGVLYRKSKGLDAPELSDLTVQYADYSKWQNEWLQFGVLEELLFYWMEKLKNAPPELSLMTDFPRSADHSAEGHSVSFEFDASLSVGIKQLAERYDATVFMVLLAGFKTLLSRYSGQQDIVVGVPVANRSLTELEDVIGMFVNTLVMRTELTDDMDFASLIGAVRETAIGAYEHQDLPYERLVDQLGPERRWHHSPLFQVMFIYQNAPEADLSFDSLNIAPIEFESDTAKFDLNMSMYQQGDVIRGTLEYSSALFKESTIAQMLKNLESIFQAFTQDATCALGKAPMQLGISEAQMQQWSQGEQVALPQDGVLDWFKAQVQQHAQALAVKDEASQLSYQQLDNASDFIAQSLIEKGVVAGDVVAVAMPRSGAMLASFIGALKAGAAYLPIDVNTPHDRIAHILKDAQAKVTLAMSGHEVEGVCQTQNVDVLGVDASALSDAPAASLTLPVYQSSQLAYVIYTSGSTGAPKGIEVPHQAFSNLINYLQTHLNVQAGEACSQLAGAGFDASLCEWWPAITRGASVHVLSDEKRTIASEIIRWLDSEKIVHAFIPTLMLEASFNESWPTGMALKNVITGGDKLRKHLPEHLNFTLLNIYGPAENACAATCDIVPKRSQNPMPLSIGHPVQNVEVALLDYNQQPVPVGVVGDLYVSGLSLAMGYRNQPELTAQKFVTLANGQRAFNTGDRARYRQNGEIEFLGRIDDQVSIRGYRVELAEIYHAFDQVAGIQECHVAVRTDLGDEKKIVAYVVKDEESEAAKDLTLDSIYEKLKSLLPDYMLPTTVVFMHEIAKNASGKVDRDALPKPERVFAEEKSMIVEPTTDLERGLVEIWTKILDYEPVSMRHNFFTQGGHSLLAMTLKAEIRSKYNVDINMLDLFENATLEHLGRHVQDLLEQGAVASEFFEDFWSYEYSVDTNETGLLARIQNAFGLSMKGKSKVSTELLRTLVPLKNTGDDSPLFLVHPISGTVHSYSWLASKMPQNQPVFGMQVVPELLADEVTIEQLAKQYVEALKSVQNKGPYYLAGWSLGGIIALEMARLLKKSGESVGMLTLIDSFLFEEGDDENESTLMLIGQFANELLVSQGQAHMWHEEDAEGLTEEECLSAVAEKLLAEGVLESQEEFDRRWQQYRTFHQAWTAYQPEAYYDRIRLILAGGGALSHRQSPIKAWNHVAKGGLSIDVFDGDHYSILTEVSGQKVADKLEASIREFKIRGGE